MRRHSGKPKSASGPHAYEMRPCAEYKHSRHFSFLARKRNGFAQSNIRRRTHRHGLSSSKRKAYGKFSFSAPLAVQNRPFYVYQTRRKARSCAFSKSGTATFFLRTGGQTRTAICGTSTSASRSGSTRPRTSPPLQTTPTNSERRCPIYKVLQRKLRMRRFLCPHIFFRPAYSGRP